MKQKFGLIGFPLTHSFSKKYFTEKFDKMGLSDTHSYELFEIENIVSFPEILEKTDELRGLNVTIPHKMAVMPYLSEIDPAAERIGAVNVIKVLSDKRLKGFNSDYFGFMKSLGEFLGKNTELKALVLGNGGAAKAVMVALEDMDIPFKLVSRNPDNAAISYDEANRLIVDYRLIINCTPLGTFPKVEACPAINYHALTENHYLYDLVYNPAETKFLEQGKKSGAKTLNGYNMLVYQAEKSWEIWNQ